jgi:predicted phage terminase large subunit-like protein
VPPASAGGFLSAAETQSRGEKETGSFPAEGSSDSGQTSSAAHGSETNPLCLGIKSSSNSQLPRRANAVDEWETIEGGGLRAVGVGGGVTGFGASLIIIDDPVKSRAEAESQTYRDNVWDWFNDDLYTRLEPNGAIILIQTRWHESDLAGRLLKEMSDGGEYWDVVNLPAIAEDEKDALDRKPGEALCPDRYDEKALEKLRRKLGSYSFSALYQQRPTPLDGGIFKRDWLVNNVVESLPADVKLVRSYDLAVSMRTTADYTASILGGFDKMGNFYIADCMRKRMEFPEQRRFIVDCMRREPRAEHGIELALHGKALVQELRRLPGIRATALRGIRVDEDKVTRALAWANLAEEGKLKLVRGPYLQDFIEEVCAFPNGKYDDQVDAVSLAVKMTTERKFRHAGF